jgi:5,6-dimethylbenzimidazole synthase
LKVPSKDIVFSESEKESFYRVIFSRRDVRKNFVNKTISDAIICKILLAAHHAPSVGFSQPWNFILIRDIETRKRIKQSFIKERLKSIELISNDNNRKDKYLNLKLEGILESDLNICITYDRDRFGPFVIGKMTIKDAGIYSVCCAVQNLWLAARVENIGVGWISILSNNDLCSILNLPTNIQPIAYLCLGYVKEFEDRPDLQSSKWLDRMPLNNVVNFESWDNRCDVDSSWLKLMEILKSQM